MKNKDAVIIFAKFPEPGKVKTRLSKTIGPDFALEFYRLCARHTFTECEKLFPFNVNGYLFYSGNKNKITTKNWTDTEFFLYEQQGKNLGEKMMNAFNIVFNKDANKAIIVGTDLPDISSDIINHAFTALDTYDVVIGPTNDGGYYLLGLKKNYCDLFQDIKWSTATVFQDTILRLKNRNLNFKILTLLSDIDTEDDLKSWLTIKERTGDSIHPMFFSIRKMFRTFNKFDK